MERGRDEGRREKNKTKEGKKRKNMKSGSGEN